ncbi:hypothetical protein BASA60_007150 [Batrachochytrium salamandrivorans]|nr:hypothetical protein BASA60_007150 [Batrachochytrium salamandrivorans]
MFRAIARRPLVSSLVGVGVVSYYVYKQSNNDVHSYSVDGNTNARKEDVDGLIWSRIHAESSHNSIASGSDSLLAHALTVEREKTMPASWLLPSRTEMLEMLKGNWPRSTGSTPDSVGCALDACTRGIKTALVERDDFASGTSSRSTKLVHGGVRYLEKAFMEMDYEQYKLVVEALHERGIFLKIAPYLAYQLPIMLPISQWWKIPYYWAGAKAYDFLAGNEGLSHSYFLTRIVPWRLSLCFKRTSLRVLLSTTMFANHVEVIGILKKARVTNIGKFGLGDEEIYGAVVRDTLNGESWTIRTKGIINATGPFTDGTPSTSDGRVIFFVPWQGSTIAGTTDSPTKVTPDPIPSDDDINWILKEIGNYLSPEIKVRRGDVLAAWSGIRPLIRDPSAKSTAGLVRNHMINVSMSGLLTIAGGKWTTYRAMAEETVDKAIQVFDLKPSGPCVTEHLQLIGSSGWSKNMFIKLIQHFGLETEVAQHLSDSYGDRAWTVAALASQTGSRWPLFGRRLAPGYPYIEAEVYYACQREYACTIVDVIARRTRLSFLNAQATLAALPRIAEIMSDELGWDTARKQAEINTATQFLMTMGELTAYRNVFNTLDVDSDGSISKSDFGTALARLGEHMSEGDLAAAIEEVDLNHSGSVEFEEFLEVLAAVKDIRSRSKFARIVARVQEREQVPTDRSGGGI